VSTNEQKSASKDHKVNISIHQNSLENISKNEDFNANKKRQELSDQLKQISIKIDKEIHDLRKQNPSNASGTYSASNSISKTRESIAITNSYVPISNRSKNQ